MEKSNLVLQVGVSGMIPKAKVCDSGLQITFVPLPSAPSDSSSPSQESPAKTLFKIFQEIKPLQYEEKQALIQAIQMDLAGQPERAASDLSEVEPEN